ncbi:MAG: SGNH/GDSL hydrolase family protein [Planctomycetes bacterium]|nr:SGNH/GDSL hydrolase family protein [Planctomycetota bacterium]MCB9869621.1 SGNH/GDSL hydrolase family protein [Planctomycetota bacterium]
MRKLLVRGLLVLLGAAVAAGLAELLLRALEGSRGGIRTHVWPPGLHQTFTVPAGVMPGVSAPTRFSINRDGIRGDPLGNHALRILAVGGSTTECLYLDDQKAWPALLQRRLAATGLDCWVGNVGKSGRTADQHVLDVDLLLAELPRIDVVLVLVGVNDLHKRLMYGTTEYVPDDLRVPAARAALAARSFVHGTRPEGLALTRFLGRLWHDHEVAAASGAVLQDSTGAVFPRLRAKRAAQPARLQLPDLTASLRAYQNNLHALCDAAAQRRARLVLLTQPTMWRSDLTAAERALLWMGGIGDFFSTTSGEYYSVDALAAGMQRFNAVLQEVAGERGVECVDLAAALPKDTHTFYDDVHFNEEGARAVAAAVGFYLVRNPQAPAGVRPRPRRAAALKPDTNLAQVKGWGPRETSTGKPFNPQPSGDSCLWLQVEGKLADSCHVRLGDRLLTTLRTKGLVTASLPAADAKRLLGRPGSLDVALVDLDRGLVQPIGKFLVR